MQINRLTPYLAAGPQLTPSDVDTIAALGFRSIIGNRPDGESPDQPAFASLVQVARNRNLETRYLPVIVSQIGDTDITKFAEALRDLPKPIFAFCRTGTRSTLLWALANIERLTPDERIRTAAAHGYDIESFREKLQAADRGAAGNAER